MENTAAFIEDASTIRREVDRLKADLVRLRADMGVLGDDAVHAAKVGTAGAREALTQKAKAAAAKGRESVDAAESQIMAHPFLAVGAALAVGAVIGLAISRTRKD